MSMKQYSIFVNFIQSIKTGEKHIIFGADYVVMSRKMYDELVGKAPEEFKTIAYDELNAFNWVQRRFLSKE